MIKIKSDKSTGQEHQSNKFPNLTCFLVSTSLPLMIGLHFSNCLVRHFFLRATRLAKAETKVWIENSCIGQYNMVLIMINKHIKLTNYYFQSTWMQGAHLLLWPFLTSSMPSLSRGGAFKNLRWDKYPMNQSTN